MKKLIIIILLIIVMLPGIAQDLIVTNEADSINCKITKIEDENIYFTFKYENEFRNTLIPKSKVKTYKTNYYKVAIPETKLLNYSRYPKLRISADAGLTFLTAKVSDEIPSDLSSHYEGLKSGQQFSGDLIYYFSEYTGIGFRFSQFSTKNTTDNVYIIYEDGSTKSGKLIDDIHVNYYSLIYSYRFFSQNNPASTLLNFTLGYQEYINNATIVDEYNIKGETLGLGMEIGFDINMSKNVLLGFKLGYTMGAIKEVEMSGNTGTKTITMEEGEYEGLSRVDFSIGLRFSK